MLRALAGYETTATLTATSWNGISRTTTIQLYASNVTAIELEPVSLYGGMETQLRAHVWVDGVEYVNQFVTFDHYVNGMTDSRLEHYGYGSLTGGGKLSLRNNDSRYSLTIRVVAANGVSIEKTVQVNRKFDSIDIADCIVLRPMQECSVRILAYEPEHYYRPNLYNYDGQAEVLFSAEMLSVNDWVSDEAVNIVAGMKIGETTLKAEGAGGVSDTARVVVYDTIEGVTLDEVGPQRIYDNVQMNANVVLNGMTVSNQLVSWSSSDISVATVNENGVVRTVGYGTATITATTENGLTDSVELSVYEDTQDFTLPENMSVKYGGSIELYVCNLLPEGNPQVFTWTVEPADAAVIEGNMLTPMRNEDMQLTVTATSWDGLSRSQTISVSANPLAVVLNLPAALTSIEEQAFEGCGAYGVILPEGCLTIGSRAFAESEKLQRVEIPESVNSIAGDAFTGCPNVCIFAPAGSYAERYAEEAGLPFTAK